VSPSRCKELLESDDKSILGFTVFSFRSGRWITNVVWSEESVGVMIQQLSCRAAEPDEEQQTPMVSGFWNLCMCQEN
jgi:hypothetical protein